MHTIHGQQAMPNVMKAHLKKFLSEHKTMGNDGVGFLRLLVQIFYRPNNKQIRLDKPQVNADKNEIQFY